MMQAGHTSRSDIQLQIGKMHPAIMLCSISMSFIRSTIKLAVSLLLTVAAGSKEGKTRCLECAADIDASKHCKARCGWLTVQ